MALGDAGKLLLIAGAVILVLGGVLVLLTRMGVTRCRGASR